MSTRFFTTCIIVLYNHTNHTKLTKPNHFLILHCTVLHCTVLHSTELYLITLTHSLGNIPHIIINLSRRSTQNQITNRIPRNPNISITPKHMYPSIRHNNSTPGSILNRKPRLTILTSNTSHCPTEMIPFEQFDIGDLE